jgi:phosphate transport system protein
VTLYEMRLSEDIKNIREMIRDVTDRIGKSYADVITACEQYDKEALYDVVITDLSVNRDIRTIDKLCHEFVARHLPAAGHLRFISSVLRSTIAIERAGDYAVTVARVVLQLGKKLPKPIFEQLKEMTTLSSAMLKDSVQSFLDCDVKLAETTHKEDYLVDKAFDDIFHSLVDHGKHSDPKDLLSLLRIFTKIERLSDQAKNICEETMFVATGKMKAPKVFKVLFVDEHGDLVSPLAAGVAKKMFPKSGIYSSAGWSDCDKPNSKLDAISSKYGIVVNDTKPSRLSSLEGFPLSFHVVVAINLDDDSHLPAIPYHTILIKWALPVPCATRGTELSNDTDELVRELTGRIGNLMERLRGKDAD